LLAPAWQAQRKTKGKACPFCGKAVLPTFKAKTYAIWFALLAVASYVFGRLFGVEVGAALFVAAFVVPLLPSIYLEAAA